MANYTGGLTEMQKNLKRYRFCKHNTGWYEAAFHARYVKIINPFSQIYLILERSVKQLFSPEKDKQACIHSDREKITVLIIEKVKENCFNVQRWPLLILM